MNLRNFKAGAAAAVIGAVLFCGVLPVCAQEEPKQQFPINTDVDVYVPDEPASRPQHEASDKSVTAEEKAAVNAKLEALFNAYQEKDFSKVNALAHKYYENSAAEYASRHKNNKEAFNEIIDAYEAFHSDVFNHKDYELSPFTLEFCSYRKLKDGSIEVSSPVPVISSSSLDFKEETEETIHYVTVAVRLGRFVFAPAEDGSWQIVEMDNY